MFQLYTAKLHLLAIGEKTTRLTDAEEQMLVIDPWLR